MAALGALLVAFSSGSRLEAVLRERGEMVLQCGGIDAALAFLERESPDLALLNAHGGLERPVRLVSALRSKRPPVPVIVIGMEKLELADRHILMRIPGVSLLETGAEEAELKAFLDRFRKS